MILNSNVFDKHIFNSTSLLWVNNNLKTLLECRKHSPVKTQDPIGIFNNFCRCMSQIVMLNLQNFAYIYDLPPDLWQEKQQVPLVEQELLTLPKHLSSPTVLCGVNVAQYLVVCVVFCIVCSFVSFLFCHCIVCPSIYGLWLPLWYLQTFLRIYINVLRFGQYGHLHFKVTPTSSRKIPKLSILDLSSEITVFFLHVPQAKS